MATSGKVRKADVQKLLKLAETSGVRLPSEQSSRMVEAATQLKKHSTEIGELDFDEAVRALEKQFGVKEETKKKRTAKKEGEEVRVKRKDDDDDDGDDAGDDETPAGKKRRRTTRKKGEAGGKGKAEKAKDENELEEDAAPPPRPREPPEVNASRKENQPLVDIFSELSMYAFEMEDRGRGAAYRTVANVLAGLDFVVKAGKQCASMRGVGKSSVSAIDEYLEKGHVRRLDEQRRERE